MLDLRIPSGLFFTLLGIILVVMGVVSPDLRAPLTEGNVNLFTGVVMVLFGAMLLWLAQRARRKQP
jgi:uncharacterized membrane protein